MTNQTLDGDALMALATPRTELEATLDQTLALLRTALKTSQSVARDDALQRKAAQVAALAAKVQRQCADVASKQFEPLQPSHDASESWSSSTKLQDAAPQPSVWSGFYNKTLRERFDVLALMYPRLKTLKTQHAGGADVAADILPHSDPAAKLGELPLRTANLMIENCIGVLGVPLGLGLNFVIDGKSLSVPMAVEEPSVVAAASSAAKLVAAAGGGFHTATSGNIMTSQIQLVGTEDIPAAIAAIECNREQLLSFANTTLCPNMKKRGGGAVDIYCRVVSQAARTAATAAAGSAWYTPCDDELVVNASESQTQFLVVHIDVDVCEAMGANIVNTVAEGLSEEVSKITRSRVGLRILTNLCMQRRARAEFEIPLKKLGWKEWMVKTWRTRDATERVPNAFLFWLSQRRIPHAEGKKYEREFRDVADALASEKWDQLLQEARRDSWAAATFSLPAVERVIGLIREIYGDHSGRSIRKESF
ncbi:Cell division control protein 48 E [Phytophthora nicotianae]|uniref:Cell division control protein 48 E n=1 Tax=Phytophthora nicotianae TaxID=4792 RepID=A0A0W8CND4_PHYNI|nr:Cell division control protein 48 E [Phytophthora nicotianae]